MPTTAFHTRRLVEHRYGRPLEHLQGEVARRRSTDPVLPIVLRRLTDLEQTSEQGRATRATLRSALQDAVADGSAGDDRLRPYIAELMRVEQQERSQAEALWDLLDVRLLLDQPAAARLPLSQQPGRALNDQDVTDAARRAAACLPRLTRDGLRQALRDRGIHISNRRLGAVLQQLRAERTR
ncbi:hypothetical protein [Actinacidiphila paucisporea]|uniref:Uncharacterized protein n=1 Tax=Actinacidiphila paucisporea TaxID=310782 RepID=A0A1M7PZH9_9ACTN|nr:hypothetical protein [Actinacidiphila paucisporea]SHN23175.1 hypothetical protein SAMN05216499_12782 [Actinacidiphila paucisporea]